MDISLLGEDIHELDRYCMVEFKDIAGTQVPVKDSSGTGVGYGVLDKIPTLDPDVDACWVSWEATDIAATDGVLSYQIGSTYKPVLFKKSDANDLVISVG
jgi:hypothetical protein